MIAPTYSHLPILIMVSLCVFKCIAEEEEQPIICQCNDQESKPVCGSDGMTYDNICLFECSKNLSIQNNRELTIHYHDTCCPSKECSPEQEPVCDNEGTTHTNICFFSKAQCIIDKKRNVNLKIKSYGICNNEQVCNDRCQGTIYKPVCDNLNMTHDNLCAFELFNCRLEQKGIEVRSLVVGKHCSGEAAILFEDKSEDSRIEKGYDWMDSNEKKVGSSDELCSAGECDKRWDPVCDTKNVTHRNECLFKFNLCKIGKQGDPQFYSISIAHKGACGERKAGRKDVSSGGCPSCQDEVESIAVCDNKNGTYESICTFAKINCLKRKRNEEETILIHIGKCGPNSPNFDLKQEKCPSNCSREYKPICDTAGITHPNLCSFQMYNCEQRKRRNLDVSWLKSLKECSTPKSPEPTSELPAFSPSIANTNPPTIKPISIETRNVSKVRAERIECPTLSCGNEESQVCDSEGNMHKNECFFQHERCLAAQNNKVLRPLPDELCFKEECLQKECDESEEFVCGSDFKTYKSMCDLERGKCKNKKLESLFIGKCERCFKQQCQILQDTDDDNLFVCDQNAETRSKCEFEMLRCIYEIKYGYNITEAYSGRCCPSDEECPFMHQPVCDSSKSTHKNLCFFDVAKCRHQKIYSESKLSLLSETSCDAYFKNDNLKNVMNCTHTLSQECENVYDAVCGSNGKTYINRCQFNKDLCKNKLHAKVTIDYEGECCGEFNNCKLEWKPVCDSLSNTHPNFCFFEKSRCLAERKKLKVPEIVGHMECNGTNSCIQTECPKRYEPVCGSNGKTFVNECFLNQTICYFEKTNSEHKNVLKLDYEGECCSDVNLCQMSFEPICDNNYKTHINQCFFENESCKRSRHNVSDTLAISYKGECCQDHCDSDYNPVCDGTTTYHNICLFRKKQCEMKIFNQTLTLQYAGECCSIIEEPCAEEKAVCDTNGNIYPNICHFNHTQCTIKKSRNIQIQLVTNCSGTFFKPQTITALPVTVKANFTVTTMPSLNKQPPK